MNDFEEDRLLSFALDDVVNDLPWDENGGLRRLSKVIIIWE